MRPLRILGFTLLGFAASAPVPAELLVSAAASLSDALPEIAKRWVAQGGESPTFNFGASSALVVQIEAGAPADVVFTADEETMDRLERAGRLAPGTRRPLVGNRLVVVVRKKSRLELREARDLRRPELGRLALADPTAVPAGKYAKSWLKSRGLWAALAPRVVPTLNVRAALAAVASGDADAGVVYATDVTAIHAVEVAFAVPADDGPRIVYPAAVVADSRRAEVARRFVDFLAAAEAAAIFTRFGFTPPTP
jgi:molybdate transport system substrate-binding protein